MRAKATIAMRLTRPVADPTRLRNQTASALSGWLRTHSQASSISALRARALPALVMPCSRDLRPLAKRTGGQPHIGGHVAPAGKASVEHLLGEDGCKLRPDALHVQQGPELG